MMSLLQALVPGMNINRVPGFNLNFGSPRDANSVPTQKIQARNISSASTHGPQELEDSSWPPNARSYTKRIHIIKIKMYFLLQNLSRKKQIYH
ncbi:hypothetical protein DsansV1_C14g0131021 [Dioscorea sansibarensis]